VIPEGSGYRSARLAMRERSHRRTTVLAIAALILLSTLPVFGHHLPLASTEILASVQHLGAFCMTALRHVLAPVHWSVHLALGAGAAYATWDRWRASSRLSAAMTPLDSAMPIPGSPVWRAAIAAGLNPRLVRLVHGLPNPAFTAGMLRPRVYVAEDLPLRLTAAELECVLAHEAAHVSRRDPLRLSIYRFLGYTFFWIPALRRLAEDMGDEAEIVADDRAAAGRPLVLASAILRLAESPPARSANGTTGFCNSDLLDRRIRRLAGEEAAVTTHVTRLSVAWAGTALALVLLSGAVAGGPGKSPFALTSAEHCEHGGDSPLSHLFCGGCLLSNPSDHCRHAM